ncbi:hypothetical protein [Paraburkholderia antibiotica]|uniref:Uncharacterized protein n=1 Tax=Paraburkholderia antibiotica TaxID=2728839 RepID=A0A7Y0A0Z6_9BURK|nr:hypothetical protein [Paraburkholderia antibiotica]NML34508.1 hypothetical protein [Paraburkholderia antibiotica]
MSYYGISDFTGGFSRNRDSDLMSGMNAADQMSKSFMDAYQVPQQMLASDAGALGNSIKYDTLNQGYDDMVQTGTNTAGATALNSGINLHKLDADNQIQGLRAQAAQAGFTNPVDVANYITNNLDPAKVAANPLLKNAATDYARIAGLQQGNLGAALGGSLGSTLTTSGLQAAGYNGLQAQQDANGNTFYTDASGNRSLPFSRGGMLPATAAFSGNVDPAAQYGIHLEDMAAQSARANAQLEQRDQYNNLRYGPGANGGAGNTRVLQAQLTSLQRLYTSQKGNPVEQSKTLQRINQVLAQMGGGDVQGGMSGANAGTPGMNAISGGAPSVGTAPIPGMASNPFIPSASDAPASTQAPYLSSAPPAPAAPSAPAAPAVPRAAQPAPVAPASAPDPQATFNAATADVARLSDAIRQLDASAGPMTVYGPTNAPPGYGAAREEMVRRLALAQSRLGDAHAALNASQAHARAQSQQAAQQAATASQQAAVQQLLAKYGAN